MSTKKEADANGCLYLLSYYNARIIKSHSLKGEYLLMNYRSES